MVVINDGRQTYLFTGLTRNNSDRPQFDEAFLNIAGSFHKLSAEEKKLASGLRLSLITANSETRFAALARRSPIPKYAEPELRLLNDLYPSGEPKAGQRLKIVR